MKATRVIVATVASVVDTLDFFKHICPIKLMMKNSMNSAYTKISFRVMGVSIISPVYSTYTWVIYSLLAMYSYLP